jgi:hypothetical protein
VITSSITPAHHTPQPHRQRKKTAAPHGVAMLPTPVHCPLDLLSARPPAPERKLRLPVSEVPGWAKPLLWPFIVL